MPRRARAMALAIPAILLAGIAPAAGATLTLPTGEGAAPSATRVILLTVDDATGLLGTDLELAWDPAVVQATVVAQGPVGSTHTLTWNPSPAGSLRISLFGSGALAGSGTLIEITLQAIGPPGAFTPLDLAAADLNEGAIPATLLDGDFCVEAPPPEVPGLHAVRIPATTQVTLSWMPVPWATGYNVYRGSSPNLAGLSCYLTGVTGTSIPDDGLLPPTGQVLVYLMTSTACSGESGLGASSAGVPRVNASPCP